MLLRGQDQAFGWLSKAPTEAVCNAHMIRDRGLHVPISRHTNLIIGANFGICKTLCGIVCTKSGYLINLGMFICMKTLFLLILFYVSNIYSLDLFSLASLKFGKLTKNVGGHPKCAGYGHF